MAKSFTSTICATIIFLIVSLVSPNFMAAQSCASGPFSANVSSEATCPSNGEVRIINTNNSYTNLVFQLTAGPTGFPTGQQSSNVFSNLKPGNYSANIICNINNTVVGSVTFNILDQYTPITVSAVATVACNQNSNTIGTIEATATGVGLQYAFWIGDANRPDNLLTYQSSNIYNAPAFGTYNIRVKDACGQAVTIQKSIIDPYPPNLIISYIGPFVYGHIPVTCSTETIMLYVQLASNGVVVNYSELPAAGVTIEVYEITGNCDNPTSEV